jgi:DNA polymerase-3 subunit delta
MSAEKIIHDWQKGNFKPVYWLEGDEDYFIDKVVNYAENNILTESEAGFNRMVFYGKDAEWTAVVNACRRYPMFSERQVVLLKEAQQMRDIEKLESYVENPLKSTVFVVSYKEKKLDGRTKLSKLLKDKAEVLTTKKINENQMPEWISNIVSSKGLNISPKGNQLLVDHIGNDLARIEKEIEKISVNLGNRKNISEEDIENFTGVSKDFNVFELQAALTSRNMGKAIQIIQYFAANPKAAPIQFILPSLYGFFSKVFVVHGIPSRDEKTVGLAIGIRSFFVKDYIRASQAYSYQETEKILLLLHEYNLKSIGVNSAGNDDASLMKELLAKILG